jgi:hypothetical protein
MTIMPNNRTNRPIFLISVIGCSANLSKYVRHLFGNNAGANPSIMSTRPKADNNMSVINHLQRVLRIKKPAIVLAFLESKFKVITLSLLLKTTSIF